MPLKSDRAARLQAAWALRGGRRGPQTVAAQPAAEPASLRGLPVGDGPMGGAIPGTRPGVSGELGRWTGGRAPPGICARRGLQE